MRLNLNTILFWLNRSFSFLISSQWFRVAFLTPQSSLFCCFCKVFKHRDTCFLSEWPTPTPVWSSLPWSVLFLSCSSWISLLAVSPQWKVLSSVPSWFENFSSPTRFQCLSELMSPSHSPAAVLGQPPSSFSCSILIGLDAFPVNVLGYFGFSGPLLSSAFSHMDGATR